LKWIGCLLRRSTGCEGWIFEDDGRWIAEGADITRQSRINLPTRSENAFHLENNYRIPNTHQFFHARCVPVGEANAAMARSAANGLGIIRAVNTNAGFVLAHP
jgi:hypothetical protein